MMDLASALARVIQIAARPRPLVSLRGIAEELDETNYDVSEDRISEALQDESWAGPVHRVLQLSLARWDHEEMGTWTDSPPNTTERRAHIYDLLDIRVDLRLLLDEKLPFYSAAEPLLIIADQFERWYSEDRRAGSTFYWDAFARYLDLTNGWDPDDIIAIDESTTAVVERLSDPGRGEIFQAKGLVVGHVQSGKTANITGVVAKAADAGYRLVIVLSGTMNLLRAQTQRRIDRELIGKELIRPRAEVSDDEELDYLLDEDWLSFIEHGARPSELGSFDWIRLTGEIDDYRRLRAGIETLNFDRRNPSKPFYAPDNLQASKARIMVVKKNATVLRRIAQDLRQISGRLGEVPALVIDDESDLASINTARPPSADEERKRTTINLRIVELLQQLPRAQYVGYTATPFANVFINPADAQDLFPKDFIISLPRPKAYMGAADFHDLGGPPPGPAKDAYRSNHRAFIRDVRGGDNDPANLQRAIDCYVLSGALKLFRQVELPSETTRRDPFRHHTMLIHSSRLVAEQQALAQVAWETLRAAGYEGGRGMRRLQETFEADFLPVSDSRADGLPMPSSFDRLHPFIGKALTFIWDGPSPVRVVNGEPGNDDPDFEKQRIWKILVGGAKLSRGYTVEGLTISYFRRTARAADTLMQMGRWFGFRELYHDLVRVFIGREEGHRGAFDIYEAFEGICRDEEAFRDELQRYAMPADGGEPITPMQVPPLVASHLPWVPPTSRNKMFNAQIQFQNYGGQWAESTVAPSDREFEKIRANQELFRTVLEAMDLHTEVFQAPDWSFSAQTGIMSKAGLEQVVRDYQWGGSYRPLQRHLEFVTATGSRDPHIRDWAFIAPQLQRGRKWEGGGEQFTVKFRSRVGDRVGAFSEPDHRAAAAAIISSEPLPGGNDILQNLRAKSRGVLLFYPVTHRERSDPEEIPTMGFALLFPNNDLRTNIVFGVIDPSHPDAPVVDVPTPVGRP
jgi:hypothetical protein